MAITVDGGHFHRVEDRPPQRHAFPHISAGRVLGFTQSTLYSPPLPLLFDPLPRLRVQRHLLEPYRPPDGLTESLFLELLTLVAGYLAKRLEIALRRRLFTQLGGLQVGAGSCRCDRCGCCGFVLFVAYCSPDAPFQVEGGTANRSQESTGVLVWPSFFLRYFGSAVVGFIYWVHPPMW